MSYCRSISVAFVALLALLCGCQKYRPQPLQPEETLARVERIRRMADRAETTATDIPKAPLTFARAAELTRQFSPALREVQSEYQTALATSKVKTPLPNPTFEAGPQYGFGPDVGNLYRVQPFGSIGFSIPTGSRLKRQDELNRLRAMQAKTEAIVRHRELYLELRNLYARLVLAHQRLSLRKAIETSATQSSAVGKRAAEAGILGALDVGLLELESAKMSTQTLDAENEIAAKENDLAQLVGVHADYFVELPAEALPPLLQSVPQLEELRKILLLNHPQLARQRAAYETAEAELHLEIARQYPDFKIGPSYNGETGEKKITLGLTLGIDLPIFDRNQQAIATSTKKRDEIRVKYEAAANRALAQLDRAWRGYTLATKKLRILKDILQPKALENINLAKKSLEAGVSDSLKYLETERGQRGTQVEALEAELSVREFWTSLEQAIGYPIQLYPGESAPDVPALETPSASENSGSAEKAE